VIYTLLNSLAAIRESTGRSPKVLNMILRRFLCHIKTKVYHSRLVTCAQQIEWSGVQFQAAGEILRRAQDQI
jgi:hypothetical protein